MCISIGPGPLLITWVSHVGISHVYQIFHVRFYLVNLPYGITLKNLICMWHPCDTHVISKGPSSLFKKGLMNWEWVKFFSGRTLIVVRKRPTENTNACDNTVFCKKPWRIFIVTLLLWDRITDKLRGPFFSSCFSRPF